MQQLCFVFDNLTLIYEEFLPHAQKCWRLQRECYSAGNCHAWWKSRFFDFYVGHGVNNRRDFETMDKFPEFWGQYGELLMKGGR